MTETRDNPIRKKWVHAPSPVFLPKAMVIVTAGISLKARLRYVHHNPVKRGLARIVRGAAPEFRDRVLSFPVDRINKADDF